MVFSTKKPNGEPRIPSYFVPNALVTVLFFLWGFSYGLLDTLNKHFQTVLNITTTQTTFMQVAYFGAYFVFSVPAGLISKRFGYKKTIVFGLLLYVIGALCFYPAAESLKYGAFVGCLFVIACGLATLENCANAYLTINGPPEQASFRINLAQSFNGLSSTIAPVVASYAFFGGNSSDTQNLDSVKWTYVGVGCCVFVIAILFCFANIPEVDEDAYLANEAIEQAKVARRASFWSPHLWLGFVTEFLYTGAQVGVASMFLYYSSGVGHMPDNFGSILLSVSQGCFTVGRFVGAALLRFIKAEHLMAIYSACASLVTIFVIAMHQPNATYCLLIIMFFESIMFPTIFSLATKGLGHNHKRGSSLVIMGVGGGVLIPPVQAVIKDHSNINYAFIVTLFCFVVVFFYSTLGHKWVRYVDEDLQPQVDTLEITDKNTTGSVDEQQAKV
ncbi:major facilitator superfamily domain-containing protein [Halteromyces radiatus]|uniref:major facilitator superfamily domain-containing protein n=1 Tax=Halteromyces radiatus TaxID=101107 RepID=UPI00221F4B73|nr:major facilitator superfamily domain-containing protein [Halteromyces radiatus]KAI8084740.1 major facilitator superfamily domain-containing protein [Halteromyces radiatus]